MEYQGFQTGQEPPEYPSGSCRLSAVSSKYGPGPWSCVGSQNAKLVLQGLNNWVSEVSTFETRQHV